MLYCETGGNLWIMSEIEAEIYERATPDKCICDECSIHMIYNPLNDSQYIKQAYNVIYDCKNKIIDWKRISLEHNLKEIPTHF